MVRALVAIMLAVTLLATPALADDPIRPDPHLTPGAILTTDTAIISASAPWRLIISLL